MVKVMVKAFVFGGAGVLETRFETRFETGFGCWLGGGQAAR